MSVQTAGSKDDLKIIVEGVVSEILPGLEYRVDVDFKGNQHTVTCYVSGKMKSNYIQLDKGDRVKIEIPLQDIDKGRIVYRLTQRRTSMPPRRAKK